MKYRLEFDFDNFEKGDCSGCPLATFNAGYYLCVLGYAFMDCPLEEVKKGYWYVDGETEHCSVCKLPWNYYMTMSGDDIGYFDPMPNFCPNCGAKMRSDEE